MVLGFGTSSDSLAQVDLYLINKSKIDSLKKGLKQLPFEHEKLVWVNERHACFQMPDGKRGLSTLEGSIQIPAKFSFIHTEPHGYLFVKDFESKKWGMIDTADNVIIPLIQDGVEDVDDYYGNYVPLVQCKSEGKWAIFDLAGKRLTEYFYSNIYYNAIAPNVLLVKNINKNYQFLDLNGHIIGDWEFDYLKKYPNGIIAGKDNRFGFFTYNATPLTEMKYKDAYGFRDADEAREKAKSLGLPENLTLVGNATRTYGDYEQVWIDSEGGEHLFEN